MPFLIIIGFVWLIRKVSCLTDQVELLSLMLDSLQLEACCPSHFPTFVEAMNHFLARAIFHELGFGVAEVQRGVEQLDGSLFTQFSVRQFEAASLACLAVRE